MHFNLVIDGMLERVKAAKRLLAATGRTDPEDEVFRRDLQAHRNTPLADGRSAPYMTVYGRPANTDLPRLSNFKNPVKEIINNEGKDHAPLNVGDPVRIQDHLSGKWNRINGFSF